MREKMMGLEQVGPQKDHMQKVTELKEKRAEKFAEGPFYIFETIKGDNGDTLGTRRHEVLGKDRKEALANLTTYFKDNLEEGMDVLGYEWASDIRGKTPSEAAEIRLTDNNGDGEEGSDYQFGDWDGRDYTQEKIGEPIGKKESE